jgi:hypothetical protein
MVLIIDQVGLKSRSVRVFARLFCDYATFLFYSEFLAFARLYQAGPETGLQGLDFGRCGPPQLGSLGANRNARSRALQMRYQQAVSSAVGATFIRCRAVSIRAAPSTGSNRLMHLEAFIGQDACRSATTASESTASLETSLSRFTSALISAADTLRPVIL